MHFYKKKIIIILKVNFLKCLCDLKYFCNKSENGFVFLNVQEQKFKYENLLANNN